MRPDREQPRDAAPSRLTQDEEITLRRVAFGQSEVRALRAADLDRLRKLALIEDGKEGPQLTQAGRAHFDSLPKGVFAGAPRHPDYQSVPVDVRRPPLAARVWSCAPTMA